MKLFDVPPGSRIRLIDGREYLFVELDGTFAICKGNYGHNVLLFGATEVEIINQGAA